MRGIVRTLVGRSSSLWPAYGPWFTIARGLHTPLVCCLWQTYARAHVMIRTTSLHLRVLSNEKRLWHCRRRSLSALFRIFNRFVSPVQCGRYKYYTQLETTCALYSTCPLGLSAAMVDGGMVVGAAVSPLLIAHIRPSIPVCGTGEYAALP